MNEFLAAAPYLDPTHPNFSTELYIAVMAWMDLFSDRNKELQNISVEEMFRAWLSKNNISVRENGVEISEEEMEKEEFPFNIPEDEMYEVGILMQPDYMKGD